MAGGQGGQPTALPADSAQGRGSPVGRLLGLVAASAVLVTTGVMLWASRLGLDLTDESWYLVTYARPGAQLAPMQVARLVNWVLPHATLLELRVVSAALVLASASAFGAVIVWFRRRSFPGLEPFSASPTVTIALVVAAGLQGFIWLPLTLSYNTLNATFVNLEAACALVAAVPGASLRSRRVRSLAALLMGGVLGVHLFVKAPAAILVGVCCIALVVVGSGSRRGAIGALEVAAAGVAVVGVLWVAGVVTPSALITGFSTTSTQEAHTPSVLLQGYLLSLLPRRLTEPAAVLLGVGAFAAPLIVWRTAPEWRRVLAWLVVAGVFVLGVVSFMTHVRGLEAGSVGVWSVRGRNSVLVAFGAALAVLGAAVVGRDHLRKPPRPPETARVSNGRLFIAVIVFLVAVPVGGAVGTGNPLVLGALVCAGSWGAAIALGLAASAQRGNSETAWRAIVVAPLAVLTVALSAQVVVNLVEFPYIGRPSVFHDTAEVDGVPALDGALVEPSTAAYFASIRDAVLSHTAFQPGDPVLVFEPGTAGAVLAVGGTLPGLAYVDAGESNTCPQLSHAPDEVRSATLALMREGADTPGVEACVHGLRPDFPDGFTQVGSVATPEGDRLLILAPADQAR